MGSNTLAPHVLKFQQNSELGYEGNFLPFDKHGNVWEWTAEWYGSYSSGAQTDPTGAASGSTRVFRDGSWDDTGTYLRSAARYSTTPGYRSNYIGFRVGFKQQ